ncbi:hypothetical protein SAMN05216359_105309 [Roseateles sp. YR242]|uniref:phage regulatory CII family protein n=1 Tax=Roseateles sp. YR242 TaxID=1855305 RepID=UPI0008B10B8E|nr:phage regulatory CII family protein [Roseateles sp. YR242]SEL13100.1 hypothetical protein SAMN05216359_105309 [Roseateles sp. YR242]
MNVTRALQRAVKEFKLGTKALAAAMSNGRDKIMSDVVLMAKVNPDRTDTHCSPQEMLQIMDITGDHGALFEMAEEMGYVLLKNPLAGQEPGECSKHLVSCIKEFGEFVETVSSAAADNDITHNELKDIHGRCADAQAAILKLQAWAEARHEQSKPARLRVA